MRIGLMLRALDEKGGVGVYTQYLAQELLTLDPHNQYIFYYRNRANLGRFGHFKNVTERVIHSPNKVVWDQVGIPLACWKDKVEVLLHPKFTVPLFAPCKTIMVLHGAGWFMTGAEKFWTKLDLKYIKLVMPLYCKKATAIISVSQLTTEVYNKVFKLPPGKIRTVYFGPGRQFQRVQDESLLQAVKAKYNLPDQFILTLSKYGDGGRKNIAGILQAYQIVHGKVPHKLVVGGKDCHKFALDYQIPNNSFGKDILFPGWIEQSDLPAVYSLADLYLYPSNMEAFPIPLTEAMACGTPIVTSDLNGLKEIAGGAALMVNAEKPGEIASAICHILTNSQLRQALTAKALARSHQFSWPKCARQTLELIESLEN